MKHKHKWQVVHSDYGISAGWECIGFVCHCGAYKQPKMFEVKE